MGFIASLTEAKRTGSLEALAKLVERAARAYRRSLDRANRLATRRVASAVANANSIESWALCLRGDLRATARAYRGWSLDESQESLRLLMRAQVDAPRIQRIAEVFGAAVSALEHAEVARG